MGISRSSNRTVKQPRLPRAFFERDPLTCAEALIGCELTWGACAGIIVETEAYATEDDEACHTFRRPSTREFVARHRPGDAYVYLNYGMHWLFNVLVKGATQEGFVLIRALEPTRGVEEMRRRRGVEKLESLCSGPGKLTAALGIRGSDHGCDLCAPETAGGFSAKEKSGQVICDLRIGISKSMSLPWRFLLAGSRHHSVPIRGLSAQT